jgi:pyridoxal 5'-phosphate synthase pdxS subunit
VDDENHIAKHPYKVPFVCGCRDLGEALRRIGEGAAMIRTKGEAGTGNAVEAVRHSRTVFSQIRKAAAMDESELYTFAKELGAPYHLLKEVARTKKLPVVNFAVSSGPLPCSVIQGFTRPEASRHQRMRH